MKNIAVLCSFCFLLLALNSVADEKKKVEGFWNIEFLMTPGQLERICRPSLTLIKDRESYLCGQTTSFEGIENSKTVQRVSREHFRPPIISTKVNLIQSKVWEIVLTLESKYYNDALNIVSLEHGKPDKTAKRGDISLYDRLAVWNNRGTIEKTGGETKAEGGCIWLFTTPYSSVSELHIRFIEKCI
jgi:hypothetical protein